MTHLLIVAVTVALLVLALQPAHRRRSYAPKPGEDTRHDADRNRVNQELRVMSQWETKLRRTGELWGVAGSTAPLHRPRLRSTPPVEPRLPAEPRIRHRKAA
ncbi:MAG: hypothetical protein JWN06_1204 [Propionibacteriaceae bacterium]|jgi:hypothetical protein|nr:hypothetical protein [Propionibacteriaceae bacterium]